MNINNPTTFSAPNLTFGATNSSGTSGALRADDTVDIWASPSVAFGTAAVVGDAATGIRSNSTLLLYDTVAPTTIGYSVAAATGSQAVASRRDHIHGMPEGNSIISVRVTDASTQAIANNSITDIAFDTDDFMTDEMHDVDSNNQRITFTTAGHYIYGCQIAFASNTTGRRLVQVLRNNSTTEIDFDVETNQNGSHEVAFGTYDVFSADDYIAVSVLQTCGTSLATVQATRAPFFWACKV